MPHTRDLGGENYIQTLHEALHISHLFVVCDQRFVVISRIFEMFHFLRANSMFGSGTAACVPRRKNGSGSSNNSSLVYSSNAEHIYMLNIRRFSSFTSSMAPKCCEPSRRNTIRKDPTLKRKVTKRSRRLTTTLSTSQELN